MNRFGFIDSSGIIKTDKFFGTGLLFVRNAGDMADKLAKNYQATQNTVKNNKKAAIAKLLSDGKKDEIISILSNNKKFEMKFENVRASTEAYYKKMIDIFFSDKENRFSAMVIDKENPAFNADFIGDSWEAYTGYSASLITREMRNLQNDKLCIIVDEVTKPSNKPSSLEDTIFSKLKTKVGREAGANIKFENIFGVLSIESHSNLLMQLTDVLLGAVMYDFKKKNGLTSDKTEGKKEELVKKIRETVKVIDLAQDFTKHSPAYFSVFEARWGSKKNNAQ